MVRLQKMIWLLAVLLVVAPACRSGKTESDQKGGELVKVNGVAITMDDLYLASGGEHGGAMAPAVQEAVLGELIDQELLSQQGMKLGLDKDAKYQNAVRIMEVRLKQFKRSELARRVVSTKIASGVNITNEAVEKYLDANTDRLRTEYHLAVARFTSDAEAREARSRIQGGEKFETIAGRGHKDPHQTGRATGDMGYVPWIKVPAEWRAAAETLDRGATSDVLYGRTTGYSLIKVIDRRKNAKLDLQSMRAVVMNRMRDDEVRAAYERYIHQLKSDATIKRYKEGRE